MCVRVTYNLHANHKTNKHHGQRRNILCPWIPLTPPTHHLTQSPYSATVALGYFASPTHCFPKVAQVRCTLAALQVKSASSDHGVRWNLVGWIGLRENLQDNPIFGGKKHGFLSCRFSKPNPVTGRIWLVGVRPINSTIFRLLNSTWIAECADQNGTCMNAPARKITVIFCHWNLGSTTFNNQIWVQWWLTHQIKFGF